MTQFLRWLARSLGRWPLALAACCALAALVLLPCLGTPGLWEPQERQLSDRVAPKLDAPVKATPEPPEPADGCVRVVPKDAVARSLTARAIVFGRDNLDDSDGGRRWPLALLGLVTVIAAAGTAMRVSARAGVVTAAVLLAMPLLALQSRMLTSDIGTACGGALIVYALVAFTSPTRRLLALDLALSALTLVVGLAVGFLGGGALLGVLVPVGAVAAAGSLGVPFVADALRGRPFLHHTAALVATLATIALVALLAYELYDLKDPYPGMTPPPARQLLGKAIVPSGCYSEWLGAIWRPEDDTRYIFDSTFEQIAYGTFPWGILAPFAMFGLLRAPEARTRMLGAVTLAWAGGAWIAAEAWQRKVGFTIWPGFPALAIAVGVWLDDVVARRSRGDREAMPAGAILVALVVGLAILDFAKDLQSFTEKLTSLLVGSDTVPYPKDAQLVDLPIDPIIVAITGAVELVFAAGLALWIPGTEALRRTRYVAIRVLAAGGLACFAALLLELSPRAWVLLLGLAVAAGFQLGMMLWRAGGDANARALQRAANASIAAAVGATIALAAFWTFAWQPRLALNLSSKALLETYNELHAPGDPLAIMGDLGQAPRFYTDVTPELLASREQVVAALKRPTRVFAVAPQAELCAIHREMGDQPYFVVDDRNLRSLLISNRVDGTTDKNPLAEMIQHKEPRGIRLRPKGRIVWDNKIELLGWDLPARIDRGDSFELVTYYKILAPVGGVWTMLVHFDGPLRLRDGDHKPIKDRCPTSSWMPGDYIIDRHTMKTGGGGFPAGKYELWIGFFTGSAPNFRNMTVSAAPGDLRDTNDRVKITSIILD